MMFARIASASLLGLALIAGSAHAANTPQAIGNDTIALARNSMLLFGGPSRDYPRIGLITWGQGLTVLGCQADTLWCEVRADGQRGWIPAQSVTWPDNGIRKMLRKRVAQTAMRVTI